MMDAPLLLLFGRFSLMVLTKIQAFTSPPAALAPANTNSLHCFQWQLLLLLKTMTGSNGKKWV